MPTRNFRIYAHNSIEYGICYTDAEPDDQDVFARFSDARRALVILLKNQRRDWDIAIRDARRFRLNEVEEDDANADYDR